MWLKRFGSWILAGLLFIVVIVSKLKPGKWQKTAVSNEDTHIKDSIDDANEAFADSDVHNTDALDAIQEGKDEIEKVRKDDESMDDLLKRLNS